MDEDSDSLRAETSDPAGNKQAIAGIVPLSPAQLCLRCPPEQFHFDTTDQLGDLDATLGQERAIGAIDFGIGIRSKGYNLFAMGPAGTGRHAIVRQHLERQARSLAPPSDWCYVFDFLAPHKPHALKFPA